MKKLVFILVSIFLLYSAKTTAQEKLVSNLAEFNTAIKSAKAGAVIILKNGVWKDVKLNAGGFGTEDAPIVIKAETAGEVIISGNSTLNIYGEYVIVSGLWFKDGNSTYKSVVQFRKDSKTFANNCRFTNSTISYYKVADGIKDHWVDIWGKNNRVDHNNFTGKVSSGTTLVVWLKGDEHTENNHKIDNNLFGERPELGINGGETIRIGTSTNSKKSSKTLVERNVFLGNGVSKTGGIRVINSGHIIRNNLMIGLKGDGYRGPIVLMNGVPNSPLNRYEQVRNVDIQNNTIINSGPISFGEGKDEEKSLAPKNVNFSNNLVFNSVNSKNVIFVDETSDISFNNNYLDALGSLEKGFKTTKIIFKEVSNFPIPTAENTDLLLATKTAKSPKDDINKQDRTSFNAGAFNLNAEKLPKALSLRAGPGWKPNIVAPIIIPKDIVVEPGLETLRRAIDKASPGSKIILKTGEYVLEKTIKISKNIIIEGDKGGASILISKQDLEKPISYFFRVNEGYKLTLNNLILDGEIGSPKYAIVSPDKNESGLYSVFVDNVVFKNFLNKDGGAIFKAYNGTKADTLSFANSRLENSYRGLNLSYDKDQVGFYNANIIILKNSVFKNIEEAAVNYFRNTPSIEISGGKLIVENCIFSEIYNEEKGYIIRANGINIVEISNSVFDNSYKIKTPISLKGSNNYIKNSLFHSSGFPKFSKNAKEIDVLYKNPKWEDDNLFTPSKKSPLLKENNDANVVIGLQF